MLSTLIWYNMQKVVFLYMHDLAKSYIHNLNLYQDLYQSYSKIAAQCIEQVSQCMIANKTADVDLFKFIAQQLLHAASPRNYPITNPEVFSTIISSTNPVEQFIKTSFNALEGIHIYDDMLNATKDNFIIGKHIASTKGKVIFRNSVVECIHYKPIVPTRQTPVFIVSPCINKYYIFDLSESNSIVRFLLESNMEVFLLSWVNPKHDISYHQYVESIFQAAKATYASKLNFIGYCIGGTLLSFALQALEKRKMVNSITMISSLVDFTNSGNLGIFAKSTLLNIIWPITQQVGYLCGSNLYHLFNLLRSEDLIWKHYVRCYLLNKTIRSSDVMKWNIDHSNLPHSMLQYYINNCYIQNNMTKPNALIGLEESLNLSKITSPMFFVGSVTDHITPWSSVLDGARYFGSNNKTLCLTQYGHVLGILNIPSKNKGYYYISDQPKNILNKQQQKGSWWQYWLKWVGDRSGNISACNSRYRKTPFVCQAPGKFVLSNALNA